MKSYKNEQHYHSTQTSIIHNTMRIFMIHCFKLNFVVLSSQYRISVQYIINLYHISSSNQYTKLNRSFSKRSQSHI